MPTYYLACDLGADSGRVILGTLDEGKIAIEELHRFPNGVVKTSGALHWNFEGLLNELKTGLKKAAARQLPIASISTDSWGVDYVLYDERGLVMSPVWCYRDARTAEGVENTKEKVGAHITGDQPLSKLVFWSIRTTLCPEAYVSMKIEPGKTSEWKMTYEFF